MIVNIIEGEIKLNKTDLDHILDIDLLENNKNIPPSELFLKGLKEELQFNGYNGIKNIKRIEIIL